LHLPLKVSSVKIGRKRAERCIFTPRDKPAAVAVGGVIEVVDEVRPERGEPVSCARLRGVLPRNLPRGAGARQQPSLLATAVACRT
jgi:hypothetical protein